MELAGSKSSSVVSGKDEKRRSKLTVKALQNKIEKLQKDLKAKVHKIKGEINIIKELMKNEANLESVQSHCDDFKLLLEDANQLYESVIPLFPAEEQERQNTWFLSLCKYNSEFIQEVEKWLSGAEQVNNAAQMSEEAELHQAQMSSVNKELNAPLVSQHIECDENAGVEDDVKPSDSVSNVDSRRSRRSRSSRIKSSVSSTSSALVKAEADMAALKARHKLLKQKHALEEQEEQLRKKKEELDLEIEIAASMAKVKVFQGSVCSTVTSAAQIQSDGMNSYFEHENKRSQMLNVDADIFVPTAAGTDCHEKALTFQSYSYLGARPKDTRVKENPDTLTDQVKIKTTQVEIPTDRMLHQAQPQSSHHKDSLSVDENKQLLSVLERQNEITSLLVNQQSLFFLPKRDIPIFDGDPLQFKTFMTAFEHSIESKAHSAKDCLYFLEQYTRGQPHDLVRSCVHMPSDSGYVKAKSLLQEHFGCSLNVIAAYMNKVLSWPALQAEDVKALQAFSFLLRECCNVMENNGCMHELDVPANMQAIIKKLPFKLRDRWRNEVCDLQEKFKRRVIFSDIVRFVERQVKIASDPLFGDIQDSLSRPKKDAGIYKSQQRLKMKGSSFATIVGEMQKKADFEVKKGQETAVIKSCLFCGAGHSLDTCPLLEKRTHVEKLTFLKENGVCFGCLCTGHISKDCKRRHHCKVCSLRHPTMLHVFSKEKETRPVHKKKEVETTSGSASISAQSSGLTGAGERGCTLSILPVRVKSTKSQKTIITYAFLDPGSSASFCTEELMNRLCVTGRHTSILLRTMGQERVVGSNIVSDLEIAGLNEDIFCELPDLFTQRSMPVHNSNIPHQEDVERWSHLKNLRITEINSGVDLLIGTNVPKALEPWDVIRSQNGGPYAVRTILGWTVNGPLRGDCDVDTRELQSTVTVNRISVSRLENLWQQQLKVDFPECSRDEQPGWSREDNQFMELVTESIKLEEGHYTIALPLRHKDLKMPNNRKLAEQRVLNLRRKFTKNHQFLSDYTNFMNDIISKGYAEKVSVENLERCDGRVWYIPHHGVYHPHKKKIRVVFDCGVAFGGKSLNTQLLQGPNLTSSLVGVITRFRKEPVVITADIEAMFHQVRVPPSDSDLLRFLWWPNGEYDQHLVEYRMVAHLFGATSSPNCACFALRRCAEDNQQLFTPNVIDAVLHNFYVDDCLVSVSTEEEAVSLYQELRALCKKGGFQLLKWISNRRSVLAAIPQHERSIDVKNLDMDNDDLPVERVLGIQWCVQSDLLKFKIILKDRPLTRRGVLSIISSIYDPLGFLAPVVLVAKGILQDLSRRHVGWDDPLPHDMVQKWKDWLEGLHRLERFGVNRCLKPQDFGQATSSQLHHFSDASENGYGTASYLLQCNADGQVHCAFVMGKARVAPLKPITIPRMELTAAVVASRMDKLLKKELRMELQDSVFWTDSTSVLKYIKNERLRFKTFVTNRVGEILNLSNPSQWRYVATSINPADLASRGTSAKSLLKANTWVLGPKFLQDPEWKWPVNPEDISHFALEDPEDPEVKTLVSVNATCTNEQVDPIMDFIHSFSSWDKLKTMVGWLLRFKQLLFKLAQKRAQLKLDLADSKLDEFKFQERLEKEMNVYKKNVALGALSVEEFEKAESAIICYCQRKRYPEEMTSLQKHEGVKKTSQLYKLDPVLEGGVLRVGGRLSKAAMPAEAKYPVILAKDLHISEILLRHIHHQTGHGGRNHMLAELRQKYWIPGASVAIRKTLSKCMICRRLHAVPGSQRMADLPQERVYPDKPPFTCVGVDCFGPFEVKRGRSLLKRYGVIFTCMAIRAIHLEMLSSLDTDSFINGLRRFIARRGQVLELRSDNGTNFVGAERELRKEIEKWNQTLINNTLLQKGIKWSFNPPTGSHHGGAWESLIKSVRKVLNSVLRTQSLDEESLRTVFCEVEAIINSRPITKASTDAHDLEALTPNHLLLLKTTPLLPPGVFSKNDAYARRRWRQVQYMADLFWKRWLKEYLPQLQERQKWQRTRRNFLPGDVVLIVDDSAPRNSWLMGRVVNIVPDKRGLVRTVRIKTKTNFLERPITKLCLLQEAATA